MTSCNNAKKSSGEEGFKPLLNGKDWTGWYKKIKSGDQTMADKVFTLEPNGVVHVFNDQFPDKYELGLKGNKTHGLVYTKKSYSKYILKFKYKWGKRIANNFDEWQYDDGVYLHVIDDNIWPVGIEYQIRYDNINKINHTGDIWCGEKSQIQRTTDGNNHYLPVCMGGVKQPLGYGEKLGLEGIPVHGLDGEWNSCEIIVMDNKYAIYKLNGRVVNVATNLGVSHGKIGFQSETAEIFYKNIEIKEFEKELPIETFLNE